MSIGRLLLSTLFSVVLCVSLILCVKAEVAIWDQTYTQDGEGRGFSLVEDSDEGYALAGAIAYPGHEFNVDCWLVKTGADGHAEWNQTYGGIGADWAYSLVKTSDGGYGLAGAWNCSQPYLFANTKGYFTQPVVGGDFWLVKTDSLGNMEWNKTYGGPGGEVAYSLVGTLDGGYALAGIKFGSDNDAWLVKTDAAGNIEWNQTYGGTNNDHGRSVVQTNDGGYAIAGETRFFGAGERDFWLIKTDAAGNMEWNQTYGGDYDDYAYSLVATSDGGYALAGSCYNTSGLNGNDDFFLVKTDSLGNMEWNRTYGGEGHDEAYSLIEDSDEGYVIAGYTMSFGAGHADYWLIKTGTYGDVEWNQTYGGNGADYANSLIATSDGGYAILGTYGFPTLDPWAWAAHHNFWLVKTNEYGVPEYSSWLIPTLLLTATLVIVVYKKKLFKPRSQVC